MQLYAMLALPGSDSSAEPIIELYATHAGACRAEGRIREEAKARGEEPYWFHVQGVEAPGGATDVGDVERVGQMLAAWYGAGPRTLAERIVRELRPIPTAPLPALSAEELATVLAGLRMIQDAAGGGRHVLAPYEGILTRDDGNVGYDLLLSVEGIDALCERLNVEG